MDCEKFEAAMIDELYGELDELTSAAMKRHAAGCARCAALLNGLRATKRVAVLPRVEPPADLEDRILSAASDAQKAMPIQGQFARVISRAGSWAMQPQTAMAAVFLLMIGSGLLLVRSRSAPSASAVAVSEHGTPVAAVQTATPSPMASSADGFADNSHGATRAKSDSIAMAPAAALPAAPPPPTAMAVARDDVGNEPSPSQPSPAKRAASSLSEIADNSGPTNAAAPAGAPMTMAKGMANASGGGAVGGDDFAGAMSAYNARTYDDATKRFDALAAGNVDAALWAARSVRDGSGCGPAVARFDQVIARAPSSTTGYDARLEGGRCYRTLGSFEAARSRLIPLITVPSHAARAQKELNAMAAASNAHPAPRVAPASVQPMKQSAPAAL